MQVLENWWGRNDWSQLVEMGALQRALTFVDRFKTELGYKSVMPWEIYRRKSGGRVMYYMIHATDHPDAPGLMARAYERAVMPESYEQLELEGLFSKSEEASPESSDNNEPTSEDSSSR